jgi:protein-L-isoaspartate O-methyltransferase
VRPALSAALPITALAPSRPPALITALAHHGALLITALAPSRPPALEPAVLLAHHGTQQQVSRLEQSAVPSTSLRGGWLS